MRIASPEFSDGQGPTIPYSPTTAAVLKEELYRRYFNRLGDITGQLLMSSFVATGLEDAHNRICCAYDPAIDWPFDAATLSTEGVAAECAELSKYAADTLLSRKPRLLRWLANHANAIYLDSTDGHAPYPLTLATMREALKAKAWRNTMFGYGRALLWTMGVDTYVRENLPEEYAAGQLSKILERSVGSLNGLAALADAEEVAMWDERVVCNDYSALGNRGNIADIMTGRVYIDPDRLTHFRTPDGYIVRLDMRPPPQEVGTLRMGCPMLQRPYPAGRSYMLTVQSLVSRQHLRASGYRQRHPFSESFALRRASVQ